MASPPGPIPPSPVSNAFEWRDWFSKLSSWVGTTSSTPPGSGGGSSTTIINNTGIGIRIAVIGDSHSATNQMMPISWPSLLQQEINGKGGLATVSNCACDGMSFYRALNPPSAYFQFGTNNAVQQAITDNPDIVLVMLGGNDSWINVDSRTLAETKTDALNVFTTLRNGLPKATIIYVSEVWYDSTHASTPGSSLTNQQAIPYFWDLTTTSPTICQGAYCLEALANSVSSATLTAAGNWVALDTYIKTLSQIDGWFKEDYWRIARMGGDVSDLIHPNGAGRYLQSGYIMQGLKNNVLTSAKLPNLNTNNQTDWEDPDALFTNMFTDFLGAWINAWGADSEAVRYAHNLGLDPALWFMPYRMRTVVTLTAGSGVEDQFMWQLQQGPEVQTVYISTGDLVAFTNSGTTTDTSGYACAIQSGRSLKAALGAGPFNVRYKVTSIGGLSVISGPYNITLGGLTAVPLTDGGTSSITGQGLTYYAKAANVTQGAGTPNVIAVTTDIQPAVYVFGMEVIFVPLRANTGDTTLAVNGGSALHVYNGGSLLSGGELSATTGVRMTMNEALNGWGLEPINTGTSISTPVSIANGGTNSSTALSGNSIMISDGTHVVQGAAGTTTTVLHGNASGSPTYSAVSLTADVTGVLPVLQGGTGSSTGGLAASTQITSSLATGTAPISVTSTTQCTNLNAAAVNGVSFPGATTGTGIGTLVLTGKPGTNQNSIWGAISVNGVTYDFPLFPR